MSYRDEEKKKECDRKYYQNNKDIIKERAKEYYYQNRDFVLEKTKEYYQQNKESIKKREAEYRQKNKDHINERRRKWYAKNKDKCITNANGYNKTANDKSKLTAHNDNTTWRFEEKCMLQILKAEGVPNSQVALLLGRTIKSVNNMVYRIKHQNALNKNLSGKQDLKAMEELQDLIELYCINSNLGGD